tara:strand:+ start:5910 stop:6215 length:306 start_codon:yes stop_codon:yes gene_type:complete
MNLILLNSIQQPSTFFNKRKFNKTTFDKLKTRVLEAEQRKMDNLKQSYTFVKNIGDKDVSYFKSMHAILIEEFNNKETDNGMENEYPNISLENNKEDIFDN